MSLLVMSLQFAVDLFENFVEKEHERLKIEKYYSDMRQFSFVD